jgi:FkbM family methyltransferase
VVGADADPPELARVLAGFSGRLAFDVGANVGATAKSLSSRFGRVVALEPCKESFEHLDRRQLSRVTCLPLAVSDAEGEIELAVQADPIRSGQLTTTGTHDGWGATLEWRVVAATTVDLLATVYGDPDLIKIDVEGHELRVIQGALATLRRAVPALFIEVHGANLGADIRDLIADVYPELTRYRHPRCAPSDWGAENHYWLVSARG